MLSADTFLCQNPPISSPPSPRMPPLGADCRSGARRSTSICNQLALDSVFYSKDMFAEGNTSLSIVVRWRIAKFHMTITYEPELGRHFKSKCCLSQRSIV